MVTACGRGDCPFHHTVLQPPGQQASHGASGSQQCVPRPGLQGSASHVGSTGRGQGSTWHRAIPLQPRCSSAEVAMVSGSLSHHLGSWEAVLLLGKWKHGLKGGSATAVGVQVSCVAGLSNEGGNQFLGPSEAQGLLQALLLPGHNGTFQFCQNVPSFKSKTYSLQTLLCC